MATNRLRLWQLSFRRLLLLTALAGLLAAVWTGPERRERRAEAAWIAAGATCSAAQTIPFFHGPPRIAATQSSNADLSPADRWRKAPFGAGSRIALGLPVNQVHGDSVVVTDRLLALLTDMRQLRMLNLGRFDFHNDTSQVTPRGWRPLGRLDQLEHLMLGGAALQDPDLVAIGRLSRLRWLDLSHTGITDTGLAAIGGLTELETLCLEGTATTDAGLRHLYGLRNLRDLRIGDGASRGVTRGAIEALRAAIPGCWPSGAFADAAAPAPGQAATD